MKAPTYRMTLSDGRKIQLPAGSAAEAIEAARWTYRNCTVVECHSGLTQREADLLNQIDCTKKAVPGTVSHDVPPHTPIAESATRPKRTAVKDTTALMFAESEISGGKLAS